MNAKDIITRLTEYFKLRVNKEFILGVKPSNKPTSMEISFEINGSQRHFMGT